MDEIAYAQYIKNASHAEELHKLLMELYGTEMSDSQRRMHARKDHIITEAESWLLKNFCLG